MEKLVFHPFSDLEDIFSKEKMSEIQIFFNMKYFAYLKEEEFVILAGKNKQQVQMLFCLNKKDKSLAYPIEVVAPFDDEKPLKENLIASLIIDYMDIYWKQYFEDSRDVFVPINWQPHECNGVDFYVRGFVRNLAAESLAEEFFRQHGHGEHDILPISFES